MAGLIKHEASKKAHLSEDPKVAYVTENSLRLTSVQKKLIEVTKQHPWSIMLGSTDEIQLLANLVKLIKGKKTLDVGVFTGYSALSIALVLPPGGKVVALDVAEDYANIGKPFWKEAGVEDKIDLRIKPAKESLEQLIADGEAGTFDFAFIDADKANYLHYYELCLELLRPGGLMAIDNVFLMGRVLDPSCTDDSAVTMRQLNAKVKVDPRVDISMLNIADGVTLAFKQ